MKATNAKRPPRPGTTLEILTLRRQNEAMREIIRAAKEALNREADRRGYRFPKVEEFASEVREILRRPIDGR